jgi:signal transduction histidine kinase
MLRPRIISLNSIVVSMERMLHRLLGENIRLENRLDPELWMVKADPGQIEQVIVNLAVNARDAMPDGGGLTITTSNVTIGESSSRPSGDVPAGRYAFLAVSDTGCGMDASTRARIFEPFFTTKAPGMGTGLGLSMIYGIVRQTGGHILVESEPGCGAYGAWHSDTTPRRGVV